jgi:hypothetical protein
MFKMSKLITLTVLACLSTLTYADDLDSLIFLLISDQNSTIYY